MSLSILVFYGSYRETRAGIRLADYAVAQLGARGVGLPMLDKRYMDYAPGEAPANMETLARKLKAADAFVFITGEYNWGMQPGLKNLIDHFGNAELARRPAGIVSYSAGRMAGARSSSAWHPTLTSLGINIVHSTVAVGGITASLDESGTPIGDGGAALARTFPAFMDELEWWGRAVKAAKGEG